MPLKFKIYFASACYLLLWAGFWVIDNLCNILFRNAVDVTDGVLCMLAMATIILISAVPVKMIFHYRSATHPSSNGKLLFIISHGINVIAVLVLSAILFFWWIDGLGSYAEDVYVQPTLSEYFSFYAMAMALLTCLALLILSPSLSKAVRDRYNATHTNKIDF